MAVCALMKAINSLKECQKYTRLAGNSTLPEASTALNQSTLSTQPNQTAPTDRGGVREDEFR